MHGKVRYPKTDRFERYIIIGAVCVLFPDLCVDESSYSELFACFCQDEVTLYGFMKSVVSFPRVPVRDIVAAVMNRSVQLLAAI